MTPKKFVQLSFRSFPFMGRTHTHTHTIICLFVCLFKLSSLIFCCCGSQQVPTQRRDATKSWPEATNAATIDATTATTSGPTDNGDGRSNAKAAGCYRWSGRSGCTCSGSKQYAQARPPAIDANPQKSPYSRTAKPNTSNTQE